MTEKDTRNWQLGAAAIGAGLVGLGVAYVLREKATPEPGYRPDGNCRACMVEVEGERVLLVDDVLTTGSTLSECARVLKGAGASCVYAATAARA